MKSYAPRSTYRSGSPLTGILLGLSFGVITALVLGQIFLMPADNVEIQRGSVVQQIAVTPQNNAASVPVLPTATLTAIPATPIVAVPAITPTATVPAVIEPNKAPLNFWYSEFFNNPDLEGPAIVQRNDQTLSFNFGRGSADPRLPSDKFSARFTGRFVFDQTENFQFSLIVDDAARVYFDDRQIIDEWHMGGKRTAIANIPVIKGEHRLRVEYAETTDVALISLTWKINYGAWACRYYNSTDFTGDVVLRTDEGEAHGKLIQDWGEGGPGNGVTNDNFSADCRGDMTANTTGEYMFKLMADDGMRVFVDGTKVYENFNGPIQVEVPVRLRRGKHIIQIQYVERGGSAAMHFEWAFVPPPPATPVSTAIPSS